MIDKRMLHSIISPVPKKSLEYERADEWLERNIQHYILEEARHGQRSMTFRYDSRIVTPDVIRNVLAEKGFSPLAIPVSDSPFNPYETDFVINW